MAASGTYFVAYTFVFYLGLAHLHAEKNYVKPGVDIGMKCNKDYECRAGNGGPYSKCHRPTSTCICTVNIFGINKCEQFEDTSCHSMYKYSNMSSLECSLEAGYEIAENDLSLVAFIKSVFITSTNKNVFGEDDGFYIETLLQTWSCYDPKRAFNTRPDGIQIKISTVHGSGAFTNIFIKRGTVFGPCKGFLAKGDKKIASHWSWHIKEEDSVDYWFDGRHIYLSNWLRFVNMAPDVNSLNMVHFLHEGLYYYYVFRSVNPGSELLSFYSRNSTATFAKEEYDGPYFLYDGAGWC
ncbi:uncharacterized protein LOC132724927 [Ruditapes philippinarum]|uniref:uncharacterized protein LOC132724927 n=1 Tax=Ruditapes philippinarum TaxID=129788 RepID=UPI00295B6A16|nr:uncharacterized protein LOC132724927 [Ruditapes philippinarum]